MHAIDQDIESLGLVSSDYGHLKVQPQVGSLRHVLRGRISVPPVHVAYAAGLYDYLEDRIAIALTARLFSMLAPGGKVIVPNFLTTNHARGYMESFMDWHLIVRDQRQIEGLAAAIPESEIAEQRYFEDPFGVVGYLEIVKRS